MEARGTSEILDNLVSLCPLPVLKTDGVGVNNDSTVLGLSSNSTETRGSTSYKDHLSQRETHSTLLLWSG